MQAVFKKEVESLLGKWHEMTQLPYALISADLVEYMACVQIHCGKQAE